MTKTPHPETTSRIVGAAGGTGERDRRENTHGILTQKIFGNPRVLFGTLDSGSICCR